MRILRRRRFELTGAPSGIHLRLDRERARRPTGKPQRRHQVTRVPTATWKGDLLSWLAYPLDVRISREGARDGHCPLSCKEGAQDARVDDLMLEADDLYPIHKRSVAEAWARLRPRG